MQSRADASSRLYQNFIAHKENTMSSELCSSVGFVLLRLANRFSGKHNSKATLSAKQVNEYIDALAQHVENQDDDVKEAWRYIETQLNQEVNQLDKVTVWIEGKETIRYIELREALALVYAALTDKEMFRQEALKRDLAVDASQEQFEQFEKDFKETYIQDEQDRLLTLWNSFIALQAKKVCHTGIRNDFAMALNGVYPGMSFIEDMDAFLLDAMTEHLQQHIDSFKDNPPLYREIILAAMSGEHIAPLVAVLNKSRPDAEFKIQKVCSDRGINPALFSNKIKDYLDGIGELTPSCSSDAAMSALAALFTPSFKEDDPLRSIVKQWIASSFDFNNEQHAQQVITFSKVQKVSELFEHYQGVLKNWNQEIITAEQINDLNRKLESYKETCLKHSSPQQASEELNRQIQQFEQACDAFKKDSRYNWIENFFSQWAVANQFDATEVHAIIEQIQTSLSNQEIFERVSNSLKDQERLGTLYRDLQDSVMQDKYKVTSDFLDQQFPQEATGEIPITPYLINRLFLHAVTVHPEQWTKRFADCLGEAYQYVAGGFTDQEETFQARALKKDSYPDALMQQLEYIQDYYQFLQGNKGDKPEPIDFFVPMKHFILTIKQLVAVFQYLPETQKTTFINALDNAFLETLIKDAKDLDKVFELLPETRKMEWIESLDNEFLTTLIKDTKDLNKQLELLSETKKTALIESLDNEFLKALIKDKGTAELDNVLEHLPEQRKTDFINSLDNEFLKTLIKESKDLRRMLDLLSTTQISSFISTLDNEFLKNVIKHNFDWGDVLARLSETKISALMNKLDNEFLNTRISSVHSLRAWPVRLLSPTQKTAYISALDNKLLTRLIEQDPDALVEVLNHLSATKLSDFINTLDKKSLQTLNISARNLGIVLIDRPDTEITAVISALDNESLTTLIKTPDDLRTMLKYLSKPQMPSFIQALGNDENKQEAAHFIAKDPELLNTVLDSMLNDQGKTAVTLFDGSDAKVLHCALDYPESLRLILTRIPEEQKLAFLHTKVNGESILDKCIHHKITGFEPELDYSFVSTYLSVREHLAREISFGLADNVLHYASTFFYQPAPGRELVNRLNTCQSFEEVKTHLHDFVEKNSPLKIANVISSILEEEKNENQVWGHNNLS